MERALVLLRYGFVRTSDSSVADEYKSPIYHDRRALARLLPVLERLAPLVQDSCGTHLHVGCQAKGQLRPVAEEVFTPLLERLEDQPQETERFWGRTLNHYARRAFDGSRYTAVNLLSHHPTVEFRLPRFRSAAQYLAVVQFCRQAIRVVDSALDPSQATGNPLTPPQVAVRLLSLYQTAVQRKERLCVGSSS